MSFAFLIATFRLGVTAPNFQYASAPSAPPINNGSSSVPANGLEGSVDSNLNATGLEDGDYEIQYIEREFFGANKARGSMMTHGNN